MRQDCNRGSVRVFENPRVRQIRDLADQWKVVAAERIRLLSVFAFLVQAAKLDVAARDSFDLVGPDHCLDATKPHFVDRSLLSVAVWLWHHVLLGSGGFQNVRSGLLTQKADVAEQAGRRHGHNGRCRGFPRTSPTGATKPPFMAGSMPSPRGSASGSGAVKGALWGERTDRRRVTAQRGERSASSRLLSLFEQAGQMYAVRNHNPRCPAQGRPYPILIM